MLESNPESPGWLGYSRWPESSDVALAEVLGLSQSVSPGVSSLTWILWVLLSMRILQVGFRTGLSAERFSTNWESPG